MARVIQIRDVPDETHDALAAAAREQGLSLTKYVLRELEQVADRPAVARDNAVTIRRTQQAIRVRPGREAILDALREGRAE